MTGGDWPEGRADPGSFEHPEGREEQHLGIPLSVCDPSCASALCSVTCLGMSSPDVYSFHAKLLKIFRKIVMPNPGLLEDSNITVSETDLNLCC